MGQFSVEKPALTGSVLSGIQQRCWAKECFRAANHRLTSVRSLTRPFCGKFTAPAPRQLLHLAAGAKGGVKPSHPAHSAGGS